MFIARAVLGDGEELLLLGLSRENRDRLEAGQPIDLSRAAHEWKTEADRYLAQRDELHRALEVAKRTIRQWHGMGLGPAEANTWELYQASPEMQQINAALARRKRA